MYNITLPIYYTKKYKTKPDKPFLVGLNWFRNAYRYEQNSVKQHYHNLVRNQLSNATKISGTYALDLKLFYKNPSSDMSNCLALIEKFVLDALQELDVTSGDTVKHHVKTTYCVAGQDKTNPRAIITIQEASIDSYSSS